MKLPADARVLPWYINLAVNTVYDALDHDVWAWKPHERTRVFVAALDAEPLGWHAVEIAVFDVAKEVLRDRKRIRRQFTFGGILMKTLLTLVLLFVIAAPDRPPEPKPPAPKKTPAKLPDLAGLSNWGQVVQDGRKLTIYGHPHWSASGEIRADGTVLLLWTLTDGGRSGPGVYRVVDGEVGVDLVGEWGWGDEVELTEDGSLKGVTHGDRTFKLQIEPPPIN